MDSISDTVPVYKVWSWSGNFAVDGVIGENLYDKISIIKHIEKTVKNLLLA